MATGIGGDTPIFADGEVISFGQLIGVIVARTQPLAQRAAKEVGVVYEDLPSVITIEVGGGREEGGKEEESVASPFSLSSSTYLPAYVVHVHVLMYCY